MAKYRYKGASLTINAVVIEQWRGGTMDEADQERVDVTDHDSPGNRRETIAGFDGEGSFSFELLYDPANTTHQGLAALKAAGTEVPVVLELPTSPAASVSWDARVSGFTLASGDVGDALIVAVTLTTTSDYDFPVAP